MKPEPIHGLVYCTKDGKMLDQTFWEGDFSKKTVFEVELAARMWLGKGAELDGKVIRAMLCSEEEL